MAQNATSPKPSIHRIWRRFLSGRREVIVFAVIEAVAELLRFSLTIHVVITVAAHAGVALSRSPRCHCVGDEAITSAHPREAS